MSLESLTVQHFRNISNAELSFQNGLNLIFGENGSGKTSLLEAIHYLSAGKSFRTRNLAPLIQSGESSLTIAANILDKNVKHRMGIRRSNTRILRRIDNVNINSQVEFSKLLPVRILHPDSHLLISSGPGVRRRYIDWGCFYFDHNFYEHWHKAHHILKQRNALLKKPTSNTEQLLNAFDLELDAHANEIDSIRSKYLQDLIPLVNQFASELIKNCSDINIEYKRGWKSENLLKDVFKQSRSQDIRFKRTHHGPHRADISISMNGVDVKQTASRGQQKLIAFVLVLAQLLLFEQSQSCSALLMIDDLASELDFEHQQKFIQIISHLKHQIIITAISPELINLNELDRPIRMFHVKQGKFGEMQETNVPRETKT